MYGIGAYFAIRNAVRSFKRNSPPYNGGVDATSADGVVLSFDAPFTPERVLTDLYSDDRQQPK
jgi:hypothetical protein